MRGAVVDHPEHPVGAGVGLSGHDLLDQSPERLDAGGGFQPADHLGAVHVVGGQIGQCPPALVLMLDSHHPGLAQWQCGLQRHRAWIEVFSSAQRTKSLSVNGWPSKNPA